MGGPGAVQQGVAAGGAAGVDCPGGLHPGRPANRHRRLDRQRGLPIDPTGPRGFGSRPVLGAVRLLHLGGGFPSAGWTPGRPEGPSPPIHGWCGGVRCRILPVGDGRERDVAGLGPGSTGGGGFHPGALVHVNGAARVPPGATLHGDRHLGSLGSPWGGGGSIARGDPHRPGVLAVDISGQRAHRAGVAGHHPAVRARDLGSRCPGRLRPGGCASGDPRRGPAAARCGGGSTVGLRLGSHPGDGGCRPDARRDPVRPLGPPSQPADRPLPSPDPVVLVGRPGPGVLH